MTQHAFPTRSVMIALVFGLVCALAGPDVAGEKNEIELGIGGTGGVYFLAEPGPLTIDLEKRDLNRRGRRTELQAILVGPDRRVLEQVTIPDDGKPRGGGTGPPQRAQLSTQVDRKGIYALNVTVSQDRYTRTATDPRLIWRRINDLELLLPEKVDGRLLLDEPILITRKCIGLAAHSGIPATVVTRGSKVHVAWAEATDPDEKVPGVPAYVATYDRRTGKLGEPALVGYGAPPNDIHNSPSITIDSRGYLHVLAGTHGQPFQYARSLKPNDAHSGWTEATAVGDGLRQTYIGLVCGPDDTLHLVFRLWRYGTDPFPASHHATLAYQRKPPGKPWQSPRVLIVPPFSEYSIFYHRLTIDRAGRLFLSYDY